MAVIGFLVWLFTRPDSYEFKRADLDTYVKATHTTNLLEDGASVYVDMSDGMNCAYASKESQNVLEHVINKLAANDDVKFYSLASERITPLEKSHTELYNFMLNPKSYNQQKAPIEKTLQKIVKDDKPALLMTDFEEYKGSGIQKAAYAKKYFIEWLEKGYKITFYKWSFVENKKKKLMFLAVFDDNSNRLTARIESAVKMSAPKLQKYVLGGKDFAYPTLTQYDSPNQGGNYHNGKGKDLVTEVIENGSGDAYTSYAIVHESSGQLLSPSVSSGTYAEYYPLGATWRDALKNAKANQGEGVKADNLYTHLLSKLFIDFDAQDGFTIKDVKVKVYDMQATMQVVSEAGKSVTVAQIDGASKPELDMVFTTGMQPASGKNLKGWSEIYLDFDAKFDGTFVKDTEPYYLIRADIEIAKATAEASRASKFFNWDGNPSLAESVKETLTAPECNPENRVLYTYYFKAPK